MCLIGLLFPFKHHYHHKSRRHKHRHRHRSSSHRRSERSRREGSRRRHEKHDLKDTSAVTEDALARLCLSLEQCLIEEQQRWREQDRLDREERQRLGLERERTPSEEAPPYSLRDDMARQPTTPPSEVQHLQRDRNSAASALALCCRYCVCTRCGSANTTCPTAELDGSRTREPRSSPGRTESRAETRTRTS
ncbi:uncharacterized protein B0T15DRAFT_27504 [Chaetomium strumarium]|uniref:Uncharacterized protein n=1 Tax=Chaetomium strumarium TaxID=1170767 RepID=A0AAJ0H276_9PEZI|nr:hypothetical protein B0T15DRAFT_27504 [Chaetomium strumarium]